MNYENFNTYAGNGVLLDLTELAEKDEEFSEDMLSGILMNISRKTENYTDLPRKYQMW